MDGHYILRPEVIDEARKRFGVTSDEKLAAQLNLSAGTVQRARRGKELQFTTAIKLLKAAGAELSGIKYVPKAVTAA
ncbi:hypothetical protein [Corynebacterium striatum]|uniref:hypothetical protein n=1 Tax=Corynebacterium striatum TaxID=43770 RepID=UPI000D763D2C|nr:hypothetical protein [Corynebacterium striatum]PXY04354.1 hypothetical protein CKF53_09500 [Corynebacterium striatum]